MQKVFINPKKEMRTGPFKYNRLQEDERKHGRSSPLLQNAAAQLRRFILKLAA